MNIEVVLVAMARPLPSIWAHHHFRARTTQLGEFGCTLVQLFGTISSPFSFLQSHDRSRPTVRRRKIFAARRGPLDHRGLASVNDQRVQIILRSARVSEVAYR